MYVQKVVGICSPLPQKWILDPSMLWPGQGMAREVILALFLRIQVPIAGRAGELGGNSKISICRKRSPQRQQEGRTAPARRETAPSTDTQGARGLLVDVTWNIKDKSHHRPTGKPSR